MLSNLFTSTSQVGLAINAIEDNIVYIQACDYEKKTVTQSCCMEFADNNKFPLFIIVK